MASASTDVTKRDVFFSTGLLLGDNMATEDPPRKNKDDKDCDERDDDEGRIPMADEDEDDSGAVIRAPGSASREEEQEEEEERGAGNGGPESLTSINILEADDLTGEEQEEKARLIAQVLELQNTLDDLSSRVDNVKEENLRLRSENQVRRNY